MTTCCWCRRWRIEAAPGPVVQRSVLSYVLPSLVNLAMVAGPPLRQRLSELTCRRPRCSCGCCVR
jgi:hypothetical protein